MGGESLLAIVGDLALTGLGIGFVVKLIHIPMCVSFALLQANERDLPGMERQMLTECVSLSKRHFLLFNIYSLQQQHSRVRLLFLAHKSTTDKYSGGA